ncbi:MAG: hypothetical protein ABSF70_17855 [Terracidiphilus sp.]
MKTKVVLAAAFALLLAHPSLVYATPPCIQGTLQSYIALGAGGCEFDNVHYSNFTYGPTATIGISAAQIVVTPNLLPRLNLFQGLNFTAPWSVAAGQTLQSVIGYSVAPYPPPISTTPPEPGTLTLDLGTSRVSGIIGSVTVQETMSIASGTSAGTTTLEVFETCEEVCAIKQSDSVSVSSFPPFQTTIIVTLSGGTGGASLDYFAADDAFGPQPG